MKGGRLVVPNGLVDANGNPISEREKYQMERHANTPVRVGHLPQLLSQFLSPTLGGIAAGMQETDFAMFALGEVLMEKGILTKEELLAKNTEIQERFAAQELERRRLAAENNPALQEAIANAKEGETVQRLTEVPEVEEETSRRILLEG